MSDCLRWMDAAPKDMIKLAKKAMRSGAKDAVKYAKPRMEPRWRRLLRYAVMGGSHEDDLACMIGLFNGHEISGHQSGKRKIPDWQKAYWLNYGTLLGRDPDHHFKNRIKPTRYKASQRRRNRFGIPYENFFEDAMHGYDTPFFNAFAKKISDNIDECYDR